MKPVWRKRWEIEVVGDYSGMSTPLAFLRFRRRKTAQYWIDRLEESSQGSVALGITHYRVVDRWAAR